MLEPYDGKLSRTVLREERGASPLPYPVLAKQTWTAPKYSSII
jgi:hypothetical protein